MCIIFIRVFSNDYTSPTTNPKQPSQLGLSGVLYLTGLSGILALCLV